MADNATQLPIGFYVPQEEKTKLARQIDELSKNAKLNLKVSIGGNGFGALGQQVSQFSSYLDRANNRVIAFTSSVGVLYTTVRIFKDLVASTLEVDKALISINSTMRLSGASLSRFSKDLFDTARSASASFKDAAEAAQLFARQGLSVQETLAKTKDALTLSKIANIGVTESVKDLTEATAVFARSGLTTKQIIDGLSAVSSKFAISTSDLTEGFTRFGETAQKAGLNFQQVIGLITSAKVVTQRDGAAIATALTNIFTKIETKGVVEGLNRVGIAINDAKGNALPLIQVLRNLADGYDTLQESSKRQIDQLVGGARQVNILKGALEGLSSANGTYANVLKTVANSSGDAERRLASQNQSLDALLERARAIHQQINSNIGNVVVAPLLRGVIGSGQDNPIIKALEDATGHAETTGGKIAQGLLKGMSSFLIAGLGPILAKAAYNIAGSSVSRLVGAVQEEAGLNKESNQQAIIQKQIVNLYQQGGEALRIQLATMTSMAERAALIAGLLSKGATFNSSTISEIKSLTPLVSNTLNRRAAEGFMPIGAEAAAISRGVGGAPSSARPVVIPNFAYGGGVTGPIVANSSEYMVKNFGGRGGSAIFNQSMIKSMGLPSGATPIAAGGFVPNMAGGGVFNADSYDYAAESIKFEQTVQAALARGRAEAFKAAEKEIMDFDKVPPFNTVFSQARSQQELLKKQQMEQGFSMIERQSGSSPISPAQVRNEIKAGLAEMIGAPVSLGQKNVGGSDIEGAVRRALDEQKGEQARLSNGQFANNAQRFDEQRRIQAARFTGTVPAYARGDKSFDELVSLGLVPGVPSGTVSPGVAAPSIQQSLWARTNSRLLNTNAGLGLGLGLPALGGIVSGFAGQGGSPGAAPTAGLGGFLTGAGAGTTIGSFVGQPLAGGLIGGIIGGITGALGKITKSYEELADEITTKNEKINTDYEKALEVFKLQGEVADAIKAGDEVKKRQAEKQQDSILGTIKTREISDYVVGNLNNADRGAQNLPGFAQELRNKTASRDDFTLALKRAQDDAGSYSFGVKQGSVDTLSQSFSPLIANISDKEKFNLRNALQSARSPEEVEAAIRPFANKAGLTPGQFNDTQPSTRGLSGSLLALPSVNNFLNTERQAALAALNAKPSLLDHESADKADKSSQDFSNKLFELSEGFRKAADTVSVVLEGIDKVNKVKQQVILATTPGTELSKLQLVASQEQENVGSAFAAQRTQEALAGRSQLATFLSKNDLGDQALADKIRSATSSAQFQALAANGPGASGIVDKGKFEEFRVQVGAIVEKLNKIDVAQSVSRQVASITNQLQQVEAQSKQQGEFRARARFSPQTFSEIQQQSELSNARARGRYGLAYRDENALNEQSLLDSLGLPQTDQSISYVGSLQKERANLSLSKILSNRLGTQVGSSPESLTAAANQLGGTDSDQALKSRTLAAIGANGYDSQAAISKIIKGSSSDFAKTLSTSSSQQEVSLGFTALKDAISGSGGTNDLLGALVNFFTGSGSAPSSISTPQAPDFLAKTLGGGPGTSPLKNGTGFNLGTLGSDYSKSIPSNDVVKLAALKVNANAGASSDNTGLLSNFGSGFKKEIGDVQDAAEQFNKIGEETASSLESRLSGSWDAFVTGAQKGRVAFRDFLIGITSDASKAFGNSAIQTLVSGVTSSITGSANGGPIGFASGGLVPSMLTDKEYYVAPSAVQKYGKDFWSRINNGSMPKYAVGGSTSGIVRGGSGIRDDIPMNLPNGAFIVKQSSTQKYGKSYLDSLINGRRGFDGGGFLDLGFGGYTIPFALIGGLIGALADKKNRLQGALIGAGLGAAAGAVTSLEVNDGSLNNPYSGAANAPIGDNTQTTYNPATSTSGGIGSSALGSTLEKSGIGLAASLTIGEGARLLSPQYKTLDTLGVARNSVKLASDEEQNIQSRPAGTFANVVPNGRGGFNLIDFNSTANEYNYSNAGHMSGGPIGTTVDTAVPSSPAGSSSISHQSNIAITIHAASDGSATSSTTTSSNSITDPNIARNLGKAIDARIQEFWSQNQRVGGANNLSQRYNPNSFASP